MIAVGTLVKVKPACTASFIAFEKEKTVYHQWDNSLVSYDYPRYVELPNQMGIVIDVLDSISAVKKQLGLSMDRAACKEVGRWVIVKMFNNSFTFCLSISDLVIY